MYEMKSSCVSVPLFYEAAKSILNYVCTEIGEPLKINLDYFYENKTMKKERGSNIQNFWCRKIELP
jgi:hypothetical protein